VSRVVLITGAGGGIGSAITASLVEVGHRVVAIDGDAVKLHQLGETIKAAGHYDKFISVRADLSREEECINAVASAKTHFGRIEAIVNNVGIGVSAIRPDAEVHHPTTKEITTEIWDKFFAVNVRAAMIVTRAALPLMLSGGWGRIINNTTSYRTMLRVLPYGATKAALESMAAVWAVEFQNARITVNVLVPGGPTDTGLIADGSGWPRHEMLRPEIMAPPLRWLLSDEANEFTGQRITACEWDSSKQGIEAARDASRPIGWPELAAKPRPWQ
jgi:NAD(P)-dependent dehydrogenase (short-subunit alcohol dehydrogenase family)